MANDKLDNIAIIGGGLGGLLLAIFLADRNIRSTVYESRFGEPPAYSGPVMLLPNGLRVLDKGGAYEQILAQGSLAPHNYSMNNNHEILDRRECGNIEKYGYVGLRIYRQRVINTFTEMARKRNVTIVYGKKFSHIVAETSRNVTFAFADGDTQTHSLLVGSDGIHSTVREYVVPQTKLRFSGSLSILGFVPASAVHKPYPDYPLPAAVMGPIGNILFGWADDDSGEYPLATNFAMEDIGRQGWEELQNDTPRLLAMMRKDYEKWNPMIQGILDNVKKESLFIWPFYTVPTLDSWKSDKGRVVILGDAAHAIPPQGGLGANLTFEDVESLARLIDASNRGSQSWTSCLEWWQAYRKSRMAGIAELAPKIMKRRQGEHDGAADYTWLYNYDVERDVNAWISETT